MRRVTRSLGRLAAIPAAVLLAFGACAGQAGASSAIKLAISPARITPGHSVTISTTPRLACTLTLTIAGRKYSHPMPSGWIKVAMPARDVPGRVPVRVVCGGSVATGAFTVAK
jgi:hypothetical protein